MIGLKTPNHNNAIKSRSTIILHVNISYMCTVCLHQNLIEKPSPSVADHFAAEMIHFKAVPVSCHIHVHVYVYMYVYAYTKTCTCKFSWQSGDFKGNN